MTPALVAKYNERQGHPPTGACRLRAGPASRRPDAPAEAQGGAVAVRAARAMAGLGDPGVRRLHRLPAGGTGAAAATAVWPRIRPVVDVAMAAVDTVAMV